MPGAGAAPAHAAADAAVTKPNAAPAAIAPPAGHLYQPGRAQRTPPPAYPGRTTVRLAALPRGPTTVVRRTAPPARARTSVISSSCSLSCCSSEPFACGTRADAGPAVAAVRVPNRLAINAMRTDFIMKHSTSLDWKLLDRSPPEYRRLVLLRVSPSWTPDNERTSHRSAHSSLRVHPTGIGLSRATC